MAPNHFDAEVIVEPEQIPGLTRRVFRRTPEGFLEWAAYDDWHENQSRARFYGFSSLKLPMSLEG